MSHRGAATLALACAAVLVAGCGGSSKSKPPVKPHAGGLPQGARVVFASDQAVAVSHVVSAHTAGQLVASLGFDPSRDGFSFQNYGFIAGADLDAHAMRELFGDQVCADAPSDSCALTPAAQQFALATSEQMAGGHCFGFSMAALRFFKHELSPGQFGGSTPYSLSFSPSLQSEIAAGWATQVLPPVHRLTSQGPPSSTVSFLTKALANPSGEVYSLGIWNAPEGQGRSEGHAVTPIGIEDLGGGRYYILIYDNNKPGTTQAVVVDTHAETWSYQVALNPNQPNAVWSGQGTSNEMQLTPLSAVVRRQPCPFCSSAGTTGTDTISLGGNPVQHAHLLITTSTGGRLGYVGGRFVNEIKGARVIYPDLSEIWKARPEPIYQVPARYRLTVTLQGGDPTGQDAAQVHIVGPGFGATVSRLMPTASSSAVMSIVPGGSQISLKLGGTTPSQPPTLQLARDQGRKGSELAVTPQRLAAGTRLNVGLEPTSKRVSVTSSAATTPVALTLRSVGPAGSRTVQNPSVGLTAGRQTTLSLGLVRIG